MTEKVCIFGSTGSIGCNSLEVINNLNNNGSDYSVTYLTTNTSIDLLAEQIRNYSPKGIAITDELSCDQFISRYNFKDLEIFKGREGLLELSKRDDFTLLISSLVGIAGLEPTVNAIKKDRRIALANKETLVVAGELVNELIKKNSCTLIPIDSEHSAIFQCLTGEKMSNVSGIILTASGGPFLNKSTDELNYVTVEDALAHPNWNMGKKITIDSATMMNKGLEIIEAKWLFNLSPSQISVVIHKQSIIHSMVEFIDGSVIAQLGIPDMKLPIQYALTYPHRVINDFPKMNFNSPLTLSFEPPDYEKFKCLKLAIDSLNSGGIYPTVLNAANEIAVELFLNEAIRFNEIPEILELTLNNFNDDPELSLDNIINIDESVRRKLKENQKFYSK
ncbi:MAG: 1-deoxy-D-xylulose-5-phosphate reductoisomerase [Ignavibacteria bacterium]|nr:1-deoxy-D-xylulose-5-phosphate reductoisomerase [Ignavibacteria bacterium]